MIPLNYPSLSVLPVPIPIENEFSAKTALFLDIFSRLTAQRQEPLIELLDYNHDIGAEVIAFPTSWLVPYARSVFEGLRVRLAL